MAAKNFLVTIPTQDATPARTLVNGVEAVVVTAETSADAIALVKSIYEQDINSLWNIATVTEIVADTSLHGWTLRLVLNNADASLLGSVDVVANGTVDASVAAAGVLTSTGNYVDAETVTIGTRVYTLQTTLTAGDGHVHRGVDEATTILNLAHAINNSGGIAGTDYNVTAADPLVTAVAGAHTLSVTAKVAGTAANATATTEASTVASWGAVTLSGGLSVGTLDRLAVALAAAVNAAGLGIANAAYVVSTHTLTVAGVADNRGDRTVSLQFLPANRVRDVSVGGFITSKTDGGVAGAALTVVLANSNVVPLATAGLRQST
jgi:hypothetical protein